MTDYTEAERRLLETATAVPLESLTVRPHFYLAAILSGLGSTLSAIVGVRDWVLRYDFGGFLDSLVQALFIGGLGVVILLGQRQYIATLRLIRKLATQSPETETPHD